MTETHERKTDAASSHRQGVILWPPAICVDTVDAADRSDAGPLSRSFARLLAGELVAKGVPARAAVPVVLNEAGKRVWLVAGSAWELDDARRALESHRGAEFLGFGSIDFTERVVGTYRAVARTSSALVVDKRFDVSMDEFATLLTSLASDFAGAAGAARGSIGKAPELPRGNPVALREWMRALDIHATVHAGVPIPRPAEAFEPFLRCLAADPGFLYAAEAAMALALTWISQPELPKAVAVDALQKLRSQTPDLAKADAVLAELYLTIGDARHALDIAKRFVQRAGAAGSMAAYAEDLLGRAYLALREPSHAAGAFSRAVRQDPRCQSAWKHLAALAVESGKLDEGEVCLVQASEIDPKDLQVQESLSRVRAQLVRQREMRSPLRAPEPPAP